MKYKEIIKFLKEVIKSLKEDEKNYPNTKIKLFELNYNDNLYGKNMQLQTKYNENLLGKNWKYF